ncbi:hypothetical protein PENSTE_c013G07859 [Penicillium steckii]|uniref:Arrestin-like N-terminal domain-containing protein n=1 Tax=Penicillium steckii TaxID=303698 RepID=A0A1V6T2F3_9EURO|nr:hypothetical protein PENSTE_c013G07859 [Penicillium steckii]
MALRLKRDVINTTYTTESPILGQIILEPRAPLDISQITITLSGTSISRKSGSRQSQCHQFLRKQQQILPQYGQFGFSKSSSNSNSLTMGAKAYVFPFSISFPDGSEGYQAYQEDALQGKTPKASDLKQFQKSTFFSSQLPPSMGNHASNVEIIYSIEASVTVDGIFKNVIRKSQPIKFCPVASLAQSHSQPLVRLQEVILQGRCKDEVKGSTSTTAAYQVSVELHRGEEITLGQPLPLTVNITKVNSTNDDIMLNDYQAMLIEETVNRVGVKPQAQRVFRILRTVSNLNIATGLADKPPGMMTALTSDSWGEHFLPDTITPTFEMYNITHSHRLEVRLGFKGGSKKAQTRIVEVQFPVKVVAIASSDS